MVTHIFPQYVFCGTIGSTYKRSFWSVWNTFLILNQNDLTIFGLSKKKYFVVTTQVTVHALETQFRWHWMVFMICETTGMVHCCKWFAFFPIFFTASVNLTCNWTQTRMMIRNLFRQIVTVFSFYLCISSIVDRRNSGGFTNMHVLIISYVCETTISVGVSPSPCVFLYFLCPILLCGFSDFWWFILTVFLLSIGKPFTVEFFFCSSYSKHAFCVLKRNPSSSNLRHLCLMSRICNLWL